MAVSNAHGVEGVLFARAAYLIDGNAPGRTAGRDPLDRRAESDVRAQLEAARVVDEVLLDLSV